MLREARGTRGRKGAFKNCNPTWVAEEQQEKGQHERSTGKDIEVNPPEWRIALGENSPRGTPEENLGCCERANGSPFPAGKKGPGSQANISRGNEGKHRQKKTKKFCWHSRTEVI